jgi:hypothetical protein
MIHVYAFYDGIPQFVGSWSPRGAAVVTRELQSRGYEVTVVTSTGVELPPFLIR